MGHWAFPHPDGLPPEEDTRDFSRIYVRRDGKEWPLAFNPGDVKGPEFFARWGSGSYELIARRENGQICARSPIFAIEAGPQVPFVPPGAAPPQASAPVGGNSSLLGQLGMTPAALLTAGLPLVVEVLRQRWESDREERREEREERRRSDERMMMLITQMQQVNQQSANVQLQTQAAFAEKLASVQTSAMATGGSGDLARFYEGIEFAKGMLDNQGSQQLMQALPLVVAALKPEKSAPAMPPPGSWASVPGPPPSVGAPGANGFASPFRGVS